MFNFAAALRPIVSVWSFRIVLWCNGSTAVFGSACPGSNPGKTTLKNTADQLGQLCFFVKNPFKKHKDIRV